MEKNNVLRRLSAAMTALALVCLLPAGAMAHGTRRKG